jgi:hypothetical protein
VLLDLEELSEDQIERVRSRYESLAEDARKNLRDGKQDTGSPDVPGPL